MSSDKKILLVPILQRRCLLSEESFQNTNSSELMTPYFEKDMYQPLSKVSIASLFDLGYEVNTSVADPLVQSLIIENEDEKSRLLRVENASMDCDEIVSSADTKMAVHCLKPSKTFQLDDKTIVRPKLMKEITF